MLNNTENIKTILGLDIGTSGIRATIVEQCSQDNTSDKIIAEAEVKMETASVNTYGEIRQSASLWTDTLEDLLIRMGSESLSKVTHIIGDATSSTVLICAPSGSALTSALMYNDTQSVKAAMTIDQVTSKQKSLQTAAKGASSTLAKALKLADEVSLKTDSHSPDTTECGIICHQLDFINFFLTGKLGVTDENNALKLGFDSVTFTWPEWVKRLITEQTSWKLPKVVKPGTYIANLNDKIAKKFGFSNDVKVMAGTTDSIAGFLASGACELGDTVTSLGSTIAIKMISPKPVFDDSSGLYSHRLQDKWLVGGASNCRGKIFLDYYATQQLPSICQTISLDEMDKLINSGKRFYPLSKPGERFPIADNNLATKLPLPPNQPLLIKNQDSVKLHQKFCADLSLGLTQVESLAYKKLEAITETSIKRIFTVGGGVKNPLWMQTREQLLPAQISTANNLNASYGVTKLIE